MSRKARTRAAVAALVLLVAGGALTYGQVTGTLAIFTAETENPNTAALGSWIPAPSAATSSLTGSTPWSQEHLAWTSGNSAASPSPNPVTGQTILYADGGSGASASCGSYSSFSTTTAAATTADITGTNLADWWCFEVQSTSTSATTSGAWTSDVVTFTPRQILVPVSVVVANGGSGTNRMNSGDTITITFNQNINTPAANHFCGISSGVIYLGDTRTSGTCATGDTYTIGKITGVSVSASTLLTETTSVSGKVLTITLSANSTNTATLSSAVFTAASNVTAVTGSQPACVSTSSPNCTVPATGGF